MAIKSLPGEKLSDSDRAADVGHAAWKRSKIERGLAQSADRVVMIPADEVWRKLGLER